MPKKSSRPWLWAVWLGIGVVVVRAGAAFFAHRERQTPTQMIDWQMAQRTASHLLPATAHTNQQTYQTLVDTVAPAVAALTQLHVPPSALRVRVVDQQGWAHANIHAFARMLQPLEPVYQSMVQHDTSDWGLSARHLNGKVAGIQSGALLSWLAGRVLGQYDVAFMHDDGPGELLLVEPNMMRLAAEQQVDIQALREWIVIHEVSHVFQFEGVPWLRPHLRSLLDRVLATMAEHLRQPAGGIPHVLQRVLRTDGAAGHWLEWILTDTQRQVFDEMQAVMSLIEGHSNYVMNHLGAQRIPAFATLHQRLSQRQATRPALDQLVLQLTGMQVKMEQYQQGEAFINAIVAAGGPALLNLLWQSASHIPTRAELRQPAHWVQRVTGQELH
ncbi:MAG: zinc-dependent metalloprotease [Roseiflexaceae bacterium]|jgi:coenzyme F420 biosynthesis associated uncharacterized protein